MSLINASAKTLIDFDAMTVKNDFKERLANKPRE
jgi:hypothetical protein